MIDWALFEKFGPRMADGFLVTLELSFGSVLLGLLLATPVALGRVFGSRPLSAALFGYTYVFRGTPILAQLFLIYYGSAQFQPALSAAGLWWLFRDPFFCSLLTFTLNTAAYQAEIFAGAIKSVPRGQIEAARAAAMTPALTGAQDHPASSGSAGAAPVRKRTDPDGEGQRSGQRRHCLRSACDSEARLSKDIRLPGLHRRGAHLHSDG